MSIVTKACRAAVIVIVAATIGCGESDHPPVAGAGRLPAALGTAAPGSAKQLRIGPCETEGETATCVVETGRIGNIVNCFRGEQTCWSGTWGPCSESGEASSDDDSGGGNESDSNTSNAANHPNARGKDAADAGRGNNSGGHANANANANANKKAHHADDEP